VVLPCTPPPGTYYYVLFVDPTRSIPESNEANNWAAGQVAFTLAKSGAASMTEGEVAATLLGQEASRMPQGTSIPRGIGE
jgi:hypothetical protein